MGPYDSRQEWIANVFYEPLHASGFIYKPMPAYPWLWPDASAAFHTYHPILELRRHHDHTGCEGHGSGRDN